MSDFELYFPFDSGPGANSGVARWRKMARLWCSSGVVPGVGQECWPTNWDQGGQGWTVGTGAMWVNGSYSEITTPKTLWVPGNYGLVVARMVPGYSNVTLAYKAGEGHGATQDPDGWWEIPLHYLRGDHWDDVRNFTHPKPGLAELPEFVPRHGYYINGPPTQTDHGTGNPIIMSCFLDWCPGWEPGRSYRVSGGVGDVTLTAPATYNWQNYVDLQAFVWPSGPEPRVQRVFGPQTVNPDGTTPRQAGSGWTAFTLRNAENCQINLRAHLLTGAVEGVFRVPAYSAWVEVQDLGK